MADYHTFLVARTTEPDPASLVAQLRALDATAGVQHSPGPTFIIKKATTWTTPQINAVQNILETAAASTPQLAAQTEIDNLTIALRAVVLALIDEINRLRAGTAPATPITNAAAIAAIRAKAGTL